MQFIFLYTHSVRSIAEVKNWYIALGWKIYCPRKINEIFFHSLDLYHSLHFKRVKRELRLEIFIIQIRFLFFLGKNTQLQVGRVVDRRFIDAVILVKDFIARENDRVYGKSHKTFHTLLFMLVMLKIHKISLKKEFSYVSMKCKARTFDKFKNYFKIWYQTDIIECCCIDVSWKIL